MIPETEAGWKEWVAAVPREGDIDLHLVNKTLFADYVSDLVVKKEACLGQTAVLDMIRYILNIKQ